MTTLLLLSLILFSHKDLNQADYPLQATVLSNEVTGDWDVVSGREPSTGNVNSTSLVDTEARRVEVQVNDHIYITECTTFNCGKKLAGLGSFPARRDNKHIYLLLDHKEVRLKIRGERAR
jgi:hypothetical protein